MSGQGRSCPLAYRYAPEDLGRGPPDLRAETLYVVGGLYGNPQALRAVLALAADDTGSVAVLFNGDFNWFNIDHAIFEQINDAVLALPAVRGNVETELAMPSDGAGCGCGYPAWVGEDDVERSNSIHARLAQTAGRFPRILSRLAALPMHLTAEVGGLRVGIVHGDCESLAGWTFAQEHLRDIASDASSQISRSGVRILASSHTCLPVARVFELPRGPVVLINNGAAGMPNFLGYCHGMATRISVRPARESLYGTCIDGVHVDAVPIRYDAAAWLARFDRDWPAPSAAALSYRERILKGPAYDVAQAKRSGIT
ncbi:MAG: hypothetical protein EXR27_11875 [Betaproteobacteria bacterium]|nr:hypothetical protein [Betaproteobacteria bacterium]